MAHNPQKEETPPAWTPDLFGPIFKKHSLTLKQALNLRDVDEQMHRIATFVPDEVIYAMDLSKKSLESFQSVLMFVNISAGFSTLYKKYIHEKNGGTLALTRTLNDYIYIAVREIYCNEGDILKFSTEGLLAMWKIRDGEFMYDVVHNVIISAINIQTSITNLDDVNNTYKVNVAISAGDVTFSIIGNDECRHFVVYGLPIEELKSAKLIALPNDLVLSSSAWQHCTPSQYEYVIKDSHNIKIIKVLKVSEKRLKSSSDHNNHYSYISANKNFENDTKSSSPYRTHLMSINGESVSKIEKFNKKEKTLTVISTIAETNPNFGVQLKSYLIKPVIQQIEKGESLRFLAEIRQITVLCVDMIPDRYINNNLIVLVDECFLFLHGIATQYGGCIYTTNLFEKNIFFCIVFGLRGYNNVNQLEMDESCRNGVTCAMQILKTMKTVIGIQSAFFGMSTGIAFCGVIGHIARKYYAIIGLPVDKAIKIMHTSHDKISCDYDTVLHSHFRKDQFRSRGVRTLQRLEKCHIYEYFGDISSKKNFDTFSLDYCYPILGRLHELECFDDILEEIGKVDRKYSGMLIEGIERSGKSRLLDAFVINVCNKQITPIKLSLHSTYAKKAYSVIHHIILQMIEAEDCETVEEREKELLNKLGDILALEDFCYLNVLMRVCFPLTKAYISDTDWHRYMKTIDIFEKILKQLKTKICILLDDIQYMDRKSWQFLSMVLDNHNVVVAMTIPKPNSLNDLSHVEVEIYKDKRLMKYVLDSINADLLPIFACQFLNVLGISKKLSRIIQKRKDTHIGWCEVFLTSILQSNGLDFIKITPAQAAKYDILFPKSVLVTKIPIDLLPEETAPPVSWSQKKTLDVCVINETHFKITDKDYDITELINEIYNRMNPYEQNFIKCAATLGKVFKRIMIDNIMTNAISMHTTKTVSEMVRMRILECASLQRRDFHIEDLAFCIDKKRQTFSDMHHVTSCNCHHSRSVMRRHSLPLYAYCKMLEFKMHSFYEIMYNLQTNEEKQAHHTKAARIYGLDARKCSSCDGNRFLKIFNDDMLKELEKEDLTHKIQPRVSIIRRRTVVQDKAAASIVRMPSTRTSIAMQKENSAICRVSIMPTSIDEEEDEISKNEENEKANKILKLRQQSATIFPDMSKNYLNLEKFSHIDYRNCQCDNVITHLFWKLHWHIDKSGEIDKTLEFFIEYSAGLIQVGQAFYALKLLSIAAEKSRTAEEDVNKNDENITDKGIILVLMGDAHIALGNYDQAKKYYYSALKLRGVLPKLEKGICYNMILKIFCKLQHPADFTFNEESKRDIIKKFELASYLRRLCVIFMIENRLKTAQLFALRSLKLVFVNVDNFLEKGEVYLTTVRVLQSIKNIILIRRIERLMLITIMTKFSWNNAKEITMLANIYFTIYQIRMLRGELNHAIDIGTKVLKISKILHVNKLILMIIPSLIQIMLWTKHINEAIDLMQELYFVANEDMDLSSKTWYYALSLDFMLDAGIILESYETSYNYYDKFIAHRKTKFCVWRDPRSLSHLLTNLWIYQLRMGIIMTNTFVQESEKYVKDIVWHDFSRIVTCSKGLECYLLILLRCIDTKSSNELIKVIDDISDIIKCLKNISKYAKVIKPRLYLLMAYLYVLRGRKSSMRIYLYKAQKIAILQENYLIMAWIIQNKRTWKEKVYNNMARYWLEHIGSTDTLPWQYIRSFDIDTWSTILYPLPTPNTHV